MRTPRKLRVRVVLLAMLVLTTVVLVGVPSDTRAGFSIDPRTLDGRDNNPRHPAWGQAGGQAPPGSAPNVADGAGRTAGGPPARGIRKPALHAGGQNLLSPNGISQLGAAAGRVADR